MQIRFTEISEEQKKAILAALKFDTEIHNMRFQEAIKTCPGLNRRIGDLSEERRNSFFNICHSLSALLENLSIHTAEEANERMERFEKGFPILEERDATVLLDTLDRFIQMEIGQFKFYEHPAFLRLIMEDKTYTLRQTLEDTAMQLRSYLMPGLRGVGHSYGIGNRTEVHSIAHDAYDVLQVLRHAMSWHRHEKEGGTGPNWTVNFDPPMKYGSSELPKVEIEEPEISPKMG